MLQLLLSNPTIFLLLCLPLLYSVIAHEVSHGLVALWFGDKTAKNAGRLTLNPLPHLDVVGTLTLFLVGFGWAKPVPVDYGQLKGNKISIICVALAGCVTNILIATAAVFLLSFPSVADNHIMRDMLTITARINIILGAFNLLPIPPLDGSKVITAFLPPYLQYRIARFERYGFILLIVLIFTGLLWPLVNFVQKLIYALISLIV